MFYVYALVQNFKQDFDACFIMHLPEDSHMNGRNMYIQGVQYTLMHMEFLNLLISISYLNTHKLLSFSLQPFKIPN